MCLYLSVTINLEIRFQCVAHQWAEMAKVADYDAATSENNFTQTLSFLADQAKSLINSAILSLQDIADFSEKLRKNLATEGKACRPSVSMKLGELQTFLADVIRKGRSYCDACKDLGAYGSDEEVISEIRSDLEKGQFNELNDFLDEIDIYLEVCATRFARVADASETAQKETRSTSFETKMDELVSGQKKKLRASLVFRGAAGNLTSAGTILTVLCPPVGIVAIMAGVAAGAAAEGLSIDAGFSKVQIEIYTDACKSICQIDSGLTTALKIIGHMRRRIIDVKESGSGIGRLKDKAKKETPKKLIIPLKGLKNKMSELYDSSTDLLQKLDRSEDH